MSRSISVDDYSAALTLTRDYPKLRWSVGAYADGGSSFGVVLDSDSDPDHIPAAAAWVTGTLELDGVVRTTATLVPDPYSGATAQLSLAMVDGATATASRPLAWLTDLDALTSPLPYARLDVAGENISMSLAPYTPVVLDALEEMSSIATITAVDATYTDGEGGMLVTIANDATVNAVQELADQNEHRWGTITVMGPHDDFDIVTHDPAGPSTVATARKLQALPGSFSVNVSAGTIYVHDITLEEATLIDEHFASDPHYKNAAVGWLLKDTDALTGIHKPAGHDLVIEPLLQAAKVDGVEKVRTANARFQDDNSAAAAPGARIEITAVRSDIGALMRELRSAGIAQLTGMEAEFTVRDQQGNLLGIARGTIDAQGDLIDIVDDGRDGGQDLIDAWNAAG